MSNTTIPLHPYSKPETSADNVASKIAAITNALCPRSLSKAANAATPRAIVNITLCVPSAHFNRYHVTSLMAANNRRERKYRILFRVWAKPSATRKANTGKAIRPKHRITS